MSYRIGSDSNRFKEIVKGKVRDNLKKLVSSEDLIGQQNGKLIKIPVKSIDLPRFRYGDQQQGGAGQGDGEPGDPMDGSGDPKSGKGKAGNEKGEHGYEAEFSPDELAKMLGEELQLPNVEEKGKGKIPSTKNKYTGIRTTGAEGLKHFRRTYKETLKRNIASGTYNPSKPSFIPIRSDKRYRTPNPIEEPNINTVVIYMMDVSGSMGDEQKFIVKSEVFWIDLWLRSQYKDIETRFLIHDTEASEVDKEQFFSVTESGGTSISSVYQFCAEIMQQDYPFSEWNVYPFHFSDGDNYDSNDNSNAVSILKNKIMPNSNVFSYGQVTSGMGSGEFLNVLESEFNPNDNISLSNINGREDILNSIKTFLGKGK